jgi:8-oxo-dGTP pyrophosphatase MutT (NUDIX family)
VSETDRPAPLEARLAATLLLLRDDPFEVLMVRRRASSHFSSALVFPGGLVDPEDASEAWLPHLSGAHDLTLQERALRVAACREVFEESGVLLTADANARGPRNPNFAELVRQTGGVLALAEMARFGHWITPLRALKRYDTHFYLRAAPAGVEPRSDGDETVSFEWVRPAAALARAAGGEQTLLFPTVMNLRRLNESNDVASALAAARARPAFTVLPRVEKRDHGLVVVIPEEAGYGITEYAAPEVAGKAE